MNRPRLDVLTSAIFYLHKGWFTVYRGITELSIQLGAAFNTVLGHCNKTEAILKHFAQNARKNNWKWLVIADDDTILSVAKLMDAIQCYDKVGTGFEPLVMELFSLAGDEGSYWALW